MRRLVQAVLVLLLFASCPSFAADLFSREKGAALEKILRPLPDFDPFDKPTAPPQFFPDDVDKRARELLIDSLTNREEALDGHLRFFRNRDNEMKRERGTVTGLTEQVSDLYINTIRDREQYLKAQRQALASSPSPQQKKIIESRLRNDELSQADDLQRKSTANQWGAVLNRILTSVDLASIVSRSYVGAAVDSTMNQLLAIGATEMPIEERRALALYLEHLKRYPDDPNSGEVKKRIEKLEKKKRGLLVQRQIEKAEEEITKGELARAEFFYAIAASIDPLSPEVKVGSERLSKRTEQKEEAIRNGLSVAATPSMPKSPPEELEMGELLYALTLRDAERAQARARELEGKYRGKPLAESARDAAAVALEMKGRHEEAKRVLRQIAASSNAPHEKGRAELLLKSPEYNLLASFHQAQSQRRVETVKYVLLGNDFLKKNLLYSAGPLIASGPAGAASVGAANVIMIGTNLFQVMSSNPISYESVIEKGVAYVRSHPQSESATEVYSVLANAYEEVGMYDKAIAYHEMSGKAPEKKIADLKEKAAKGFLQAAERSAARSAKEGYLEAILDIYPESEAAKEAMRRLALLSRVENQGLRISKNFLIEHPELYGSGGLRLKSTLLDGKIGNMELADSGVNLLSDQEILLHLQTPWGLQRQTYALEKSAAENFVISLRKKNYALALEDIETRPKGSPGGLKDLPPALLKGKPTTEEKDGEDANLSLVREATGPRPAFPRILDHQLLTENEKNPTSKFKLPPIQGSISASGVDVSGSMPTGLWGNQLMVGTDARSPFAGAQLPIPLLQDFIPVDFLFQGRPGGLSVFPKIHLSKDKGDDQELYR